MIPFPLYLSALNVLTQLLHFIILHNYNNNIYIYFTKYNTILAPKSTVYKVIIKLIGQLCDTQVVV